MIRPALTALALVVAMPVAAQTSPTSPPPGPGSGQGSGSLIGPALFVSDVAQALHFYIDGLGLKVAMQMGPPERRETILSFGGDPSSPGIILLADTRPGARASIAHEHGYDRSVLRMNDLDVVAGRLKAAGFAPSPIRDVAKGYRMMMVTDPDGYRYELVERRGMGGVSK